MSRPINDQRWHRLTDEITTGMREWRLQHPKATLREMETELDARWARVRSRMLEDMALQSTASGWADAPVTQRPTCPDCGVTLHEWGHHTRTLHPHGGEPVTLTRSYGVCPVCGTGLFPPR